LINHTNEVDESNDSSDSLAGVPGVATRAFEKSCSDLLLVVVPAAEPDGFGALGVISLPAVGTVRTAAIKHKTWQCHLWECSFL
jgi:hypothetical protein